MSKPYVPYGMKRYRISQDVHCSFYPVTTSRHFIISLSNHEITAYLSIQLFPSVMLGAGGHCGIVPSQNVKSLQVVGSASRHLMPVVLVYKQSLQHGES